MKRLILLLSFALSGCVAVESYFMAKYDNIEHFMINDIRTTAEIADCSNPIEMRAIANKLYVASASLKNYSSSIPENDPAATIAENLHEIVTGMHNKYQKSNEVKLTYCKLKVESIVAASIEAQRVIARKPR